MIDSKLIEQLAAADGFPVDWAGRDENGNYQLKSNVFRVTSTPAPMFGQNVRDFGYDKACEIAESKKIVDHDFGACYIKPKSLRKLGTGVDARWHVDLSVDPNKVRFEPVTTMLVDKQTGEPIMGENGKPQVKVADRKEAWITCELSQLEPVTDHLLSAPYTQSDRRTVAMLKNTAKAKAPKGERKRGPGRGKGSRKRLSPDEIAALTADA